jgi:hypothetical protein
MGVDAFHFADLLGFALEKTGLRGALSLLRGQNADYTGVATGGSVRHPLITA